MKFEKMKLIADYFGVPTEYLLTGVMPETGEQYYSPEAKEIAQQVGHAEGDDKGVVGKTSPKETGKDLFPHQSQHAAAHDCQTDSPGGTGNASSALGGFGRF